MKKLLFMLVLCLICQISCEAKDYAKLQIKEMKHAQKYGVATKMNKSYAPVTTSTLAKSIKDPKLLKIGTYKDITDAQYKAKLAKDELEYAKVYKELSSKKTDNYHSQAYTEDFYEIYRVAEKIIRANNLDFANWRITVQKNTDFNAYNSNTNNVIILTGLYDTYRGDDEALAFIIGHEMGHGVLGHQPRKTRLIKKINIAASAGKDGSLAYLVGKKRYLIESKNMEYAADVEGAKFVAKAGYNLDKARGALEFLNTIDDGSWEWKSTHPNTEHRLQNYDENRKFFPEEEWVKQGRYNIYNSSVLKCQKSSDRKSIVIFKDTAGKSGNYYAPESPVEIYKRYGYMSYLNGDFKNAVKYFKQVLDNDKSDYAVYLYLSYAYEYLGNKASAKEFAEYAKTLAPDNKYVNEQIQAL